MYVVTLQSPACCRDVWPFSRPHGNSCSVRLTEWWEIWAGWVDLCYYVGRSEQACKRLYGCSAPVVLSSSKAPESRRFGKHRTRQTLVYIFFLLSCTVTGSALPPGISATFRWLSSNINGLTFTGRRVIYVGRLWTFATPPECIPVVSLMSTTESVTQRNTLKQHNALLVLLQGSSASPILPGEPMGSPWWSWTTVGSGMCTLQRLCCRLGRN